MSRSCCSLCLGVVLWLCCVLVWGQAGQVWAASGASASSRPASRPSTRPVKQPSSRPFSLREAKLHAQRTRLLWLWGWLTQSQQHSVLGLQWELYRAKGVISEPMRQMMGAFIHPEQGDLGAPRRLCRRFRSSMRSVFWRQVCRSLRKGQLYAMSSPSVLLLARWRRALRAERRLQPGQLGPLLDLLALYPFYFGILGSDRLQLHKQLRGLLRTLQAFPVAAPWAKALMLWSHLQVFRYIKKRDLLKDGAAKARVALRKECKALLQWMPQYPEMPVLGLVGWWVAKALHEPLLLRQIVKGLRFPKVSKAKKKRRLCQPIKFLYSIQILDDKSRKPVKIFECESATNCRFLFRDEDTNNPSVKTRQKIYNATALYMALREQLSFCQAYLHEPLLISLFAVSSFPIRVFHSQLNVRLFKRFTRWAKRTPQGRLQDPMVALLGSVMLLATDEKRGLKRFRRVAFVKRPRLWGSSIRKSLVRLLIRNREAAFAFSLLQKWPGQTLLWREALRLARTKKGRRLSRVWMARHWKARKWMRSARLVHLWVYHLYRTKRYERMMGLCREGLKKHPKDVELLVFCGNRAYYRKQNTLALKWGRRAFVRQPAHLRAMYLLRRALRRAKKPKELAKAYATFFQESHGRALLQRFYLRFWFSFSRADLPFAQAWRERLLARVGRYPGWSRWLGVLKRWSFRYVWRKQRERAVKLWERVAFSVERSNRLYTSSVAQLGLLHQVGQWDEIQTLLRALLRSPLMKKLHRRLLFRMMIKIKRTKKKADLVAFGRCLKALSQALPAHPEVTLMGGMVAWSLGKKQEARVHFKRFFRDRRVARQYGLYVSRLYMRRWKAPKQAVLFWQAYLAHQPWLIRTPRVLVAYAKALESAGRSKKAEVQWKKLISLFPHRRLLYRWLAAFYRRHKTPKKELALWQRYVREHPNSHWGRYQRGQWFLKHKQPKRACRDFHEAAKARYYEDRYKGLMGLSRCHQALGKGRRALSFFAKAIPYKRDRKERRTLWIDLAKKYVNLLKVYKPTVKSGRERLLILLLRSRWALNRALRLSTKPERPRVLFLLGNVEVTLSRAYKYIGLIRVKRLCRNAKKREVKERACRLFRSWRR